MVIRHIDTNSKIYKSLTIAEKIEYERMSKAQYELRYFSNNNTNKMYHQFKSN